MTHEDPHRGGGPASVRPLSEREVERFHELGYLVIPGFLSSAELAAARGELAAQFPTWGQVHGDPESWKEIAGEGQAFVEAPFPGEVLNHIGTHPDAISIAEELLRVEEVFLSQSLIWAKYAAMRQFEQKHHLDYHDTTLVMPRSDGRYSPLYMILYYTDVPKDMGPTSVVPSTLPERRPLVPRRRDRALDPELYEREIDITVPAGALLCLSATTLHRATSFRADSGLRISHHLTWREAGAEWMSWRGWAQFAHGKEMRAWLQSTSVRQRSVVGFPKPGHPYWTQETIELVQARYPAMDLTPYRAAMETHRGPGAQ